MFVESEIKKRARSSGAKPDIALLRSAGNVHFDFYKHVAPNGARAFASGPTNISLLAERDLFIHRLRQTCRA